MHNFSRYNDLIGQLETKIENVKCQRDNFKKNPISWTNNKRKRHGIPMRRGRKKPSKYHFPTFDLFPIIDELVEIKLDEYVKESFTDFVSIKDLCLGDKL